MFKRNELDELPQSFRNTILFSNRKIHVTTVVYLDTQNSVSPFK